MDNYVIRIYRRDETNPRKIMGLVIEPETGAEQRFSNVDELVEKLLGLLDSTEDHAADKA